MQTIETTAARMQEEQMEVQQPIELSACAKLFIEHCCKLRYMEKKSGLVYWGKLRKIDIPSLYVRIERVPFDEEDTALKVCVSEKSVTLHLESILLHAYANAPAITVTLTGLITLDGIQRGLDVIASRLQEICKDPVHIKEVQHAAKCLARSVD